ncbi:MAG: hypothetical protein SOZ94_06075 [Prevotella sp.]|nr:hypothetical protein [Prevotella sp.]
MRKKFLSAFLLGALALGATSTIVSCKDYDGDISELRQDINSLDATLKSELQSVKDQLTAQKSELETKIADAQATLQAAIDKKADKTTVDALATRVTDLEKELGVVNSRLKTIDATLAEVNASIADLKANKADKTEVAELRLFVETELAAIKGDISGLQTAVKEILADIAGIKGDINGIKGDISDLQKKDIELFAAINQEALDRAAAISALDKELSAKIKTVADNLADFIKEQNEFNEAVITEISNINGALVNIAGQIEALQMVDEGLDNRITALETRLQGYEGVVADLRQAQKDIAALQKDVKKAFEDIATNAANIEANAKAIDALSQRVTTEVQTLDSKISAVDAKVNALTVCVTKRLTSIYFAPSTFVDGVECIDFASLNYIDWGTEPTDWLANYAPENGVENRIDDGTTTAVYYLNPSGVDEESIEGGVRGLSFISNTASNITATRGAATPVVSVKSGTIENGKLTLQLTKNSAAINNSNENFTIVSLKAPLSEKVKTASEKGKEINVYSDWARLTESVVRPYIHNIKTVTDGKADERAEFAHFYRFGDIYSMYSETFDGIRALNYTQYTSQSRDSKRKYFVAYNKPFDVKELTTVCDHNGNVINYESYGLKFEYNLMKCYWVLNEGNTTDATNQQLYATINDGVVASTAPGVTGANRAAIGKSPVVQIVLRDTKNNAVVDVRYIMIQWVEKDVETIVLDNINKQTTWDCGEIATCKIGEAELNKLAAQLNLETVTEFSSRFTVASDLVDADGKKIGTVDKKENGEAAGQIDNILVTFETPMIMTKELYEGGSVTYTGYIFIQSKTEPLQYKVPVVLTATFDKSRQLALNKDYKENENYWKGVDINRYVVANPTLEANDTKGYTLANGFHDTQILYNLLNAYLKGTSAPKDVENLVLNLQKADGDNARFVFDEQRVPEVLGTDWSVTDNGTTLRYSGDIAATITRNGFVQLHEVTNKGKHAHATNAAKMLVAYDETPATEATKNAVPVKIVGTLCDYDVVLSQFLVRFEKPIDLAWDKVAVTLKDQHSAGFTETLPWQSMIVVKEAYNRYRPIIDNLNNDATLRSWYGYYKNGKNDIYPYINVAEAKLDGKKLSSYKNENGTPMYELKYEDDAAHYGANAKFTFFNNSGNAITKDLVITVPVTVDSKWRTWKNTVTITVSETTTTAKRR